MTRSRVLVSAHRGGAGADALRENTVEAFISAIEAGTDYVEFDVHRCADGTFVVHHDAQVFDRGRRRPIAQLSFAEFSDLAAHVLTLAEALTVLAEHGGRAHLDIKFRSPAESVYSPVPEIEVVRTAVAALGVSNLVVTTGQETVVHRLRDWSAEQQPDLLVGLSVGRNTRGRPWRTALRMQYEDFFPARRIARSRANVVVCSQEIALLTVRRWARRAKLPLLVWTVDRPRSLGYWMRPGRAWMVTTNHPSRALDIRAERESR